MAIARTFRDLKVYQQAREAYLSPEEFNALDSKCISIGQMLSRMIDRADDFSKHSPATDYRAIPRVEEKDATDEQSSNIAEFFA